MLVGRLGSLPLLLLREVCNLVNDPLSRPTRSGTCSCAPCSQSWPAPQVRDACPQDEGLQLLLVRDARRGSGTSAWLRHDLPLAARLAGLLGHLRLRDPAAIRRKQWPRLQGVALRSRPPSCRTCTTSRRSSLAMKSPGLASQHHWEQCLALLVQCDVVILEELLLHPPPICPRPLGMSTLLLSQSIAL